MQLAGDKRSSRCSSNTGFDQEEQLLDTILFLWSRYVFFLQNTCLATCWLWAKVPLTDIIICLGATANPLSHRLWDIIGRNSSCSRKFWHYKIACWTQNMFLNLSYSYLGKKRLLVKSSNYYSSNKSWYWFNFFCNGIHDPFI